MGTRQVESTIPGLRIRMRYRLIIVRIRMRYRSKTSGSARGSGMYRTCGSAEKVRARWSGSAENTADPHRRIRKKKCGSAPADPQKDADLLKRICRKKCGSAQADPQ